MWYWDDFVGRYRDEKGRFVAWSTIKSLVDESLRSSSSVADYLASMVANGQISPKDWVSSFREEIKSEYIRQYIAGIGGRDMMTAGDWGSIGGMLQEQYKYLDGFANEIALGNLSEAQIQARAKMYINSAEEALERAKEKTAKKLKFDMVHWVVTPGENCDDCINYENKGWQPMAIDPFKGAYPGSGDTLCLTNCHCHLEYMNSETGVTYGAD